MKRVTGPVPATSRRPRTELAVLVAGCVVGAGVHGAVLGFEEVDDLDPVGGYYLPQGVSFSQGLVLEAGVSLNEFEFPPRGGTKVAVDYGGEIAGSFSVPVSLIGGFFTYSQRATLTGYDDVGNVVAQKVSTFDSNLGFSTSNPPNEYLEITSAAGFYSFSIEADPLGESVALDDFTFIPIPEPRGAIAFAGLLLLAALRRGR